VEVTLEEEGPALWDEEGELAFCRMRGKRRRNKVKGLGESQSE
jgi:hypothetical protein